MKKLFIIPIVALMVSCQPSKITQTWTAENAVPKKYKKILVLGVLTDNDNELQIKIEDHLAGDMKDLGYNAIAANKVFAPGTFSKGDTAKAQEAIEGKGFDAVLTVVLVDKKKDRYYVPGKLTEYNTYYTSFGRFDRYYSIVTERIYTPGYYGEETKYTWENNFYDLESRKMIYSARTRSFDYTSKTTLAHTYGELMAESLVNKKILIKPEKMEEE